MKKILINGTPLMVDPDAAIAQGGEADIFDLRNGFVLKLYKRADHPDFLGFPEEQHKAEDRLRRQQMKLPAFPKGLPARVVAPCDLALEKKSKNIPGMIVGFTMPYIRGTELLRYGQRNFRQGIPSGEVTEIFRDLHGLVADLHRHGVVIGDFNDLNVLVQGRTTHLIDADSFQFGPYLCLAYTECFVDPLLCDSAATRPVLAKPYTPNSDWYAFLVMLIKSLLCVDPYGGVYRPKQGVKIPPFSRPLHRITIFHPEVQYPKPAIPYGVLPDDLLDYCHRVFEKDERGTFPFHLFETLEWTTCSGCGIEHARSVCPRCSIAAPAHLKATIFRGTIDATEIFRTSGRILAARLSLNGTPQWLHHEGGSYRRESGEIVMSGSLIPRARYRLSGARTVLGHADKVVILGTGKNVRQLAVDTVGSAPMFDATAERVFWVENGRLQRENRFGSETIGTVLNNQTLFWIGDTFGFGLYRAGGLSVAFVFDADEGGLKDTVKLPPFHGRILDADCVFGTDRAWFLMETLENGKRINRAIVIHRSGSVEAMEALEANDDSWLATIHGACTIGEALLKPTDDGILRVEIKHGRIIKTRAFPDTASVVDSASQLLAGRDGVYVVTAQAITRLRFTSHASSS